MGSFFEEKEEVCTPSTLGECPITLAKELLAPFCPPAAGKKKQIRKCEAQKIQFWWKRREVHTVNRDGTAFNWYSTVEYID